MAPQYKLVYFNVRGAAEFIRILFKYGEIEFEDVRIEHKDWPEIKPTTPFGVLPYLEINGEKIGETVAIGRFVGKLVGLAGKDPLENLKIDSFVDSYTDIRVKFTTAFHEQDPEKKKELLKTIAEEHLPFYFGKFEELVKKNNGYVALNRLTWADVMLAVQIPVIQFLLGDDKILDKYPNVLALQKKVENIPQIKKWMETRPQTQS